VNIEDAVGLQRPGEYHADTSELIQMLQKGHYGVKLASEDWQRLVTWIDLNGPCHGTWGDVADIPGRVDQRRQQLATEYGIDQLPPEVVPDYSSDASEPSQQNRELAVSAADRLRHVEALTASLHQRRSSESFSQGNTKLDVGGDQQVELVWVPAGRFVMGDTDGTGAEDEWPASVVEIPQGFWISRGEITNGQFRTLFPNHSSGVFTKRQVEFDGPGVQLDDPRQPVVRVSWQEAMEFCRQLSAATGRTVSLPTEAQWEYSARAGTRSAFSFGPLNADFSSHANMADRSIACLYSGTAGVANMQPIPAVMHVDDLAIATTHTTYHPNPWGLLHMHGNAAEWTRSLWRPYPYDDHDGRNELLVDDASAMRVVRGGSFYDRPHRCRSAYRLAYPSWQAVHNVGFRIVVED
jgi:formylglycine-generating enzyme required for sulfatase activity